MASLLLVNLDLLQLAIHWRPSHSRPNKPLPNPATGAKQRCIPDNDTRKLADIQGDYNLLDQ